MIWLICGIGGLTTALFFICCVWPKWTKEAVEAGAYCMEPVKKLSYEELESAVKKMDEENDRLCKKVSDLEAEIKWMGSNPFGD